MNLLETKVVAIVALGIGSMIIGILPACLAQRTRNNSPLILSCLLCFGGGVLLATSLVHILPELREQMSVSFSQYAEIIFCAGFFILYLIDELVHLCYGEESNSHSPISSNSHNHHHQRANGKRRTYGSYDHGNHGSESEDTALIGRPPPYNPNFYRTRSDSELFLDNNTPSQLCHGQHQEPCQRSAPASNFGLLVALSVHALLEGLVIGLENSSSKVLLMLAAVASHKLVMAFCLGIEITTDPLVTFCRHFTYIFIFTIGSLGGILIGMLVTNLPSEMTEAVIPILQGLAGGTLLYVTVCEILPRERAQWHLKHNKKSAGIVQFLSVIVGFSLLTILSKTLES